VEEFIDHPQDEDADWEAEEGPEGDLKRGLGD
jgi:hypothetical protein